MLEKTDGERQIEHRFVIGLSGCLKNDWLRSGFLALLAFVIHLPALSGEPIWDDAYLAGTNPFMKSPLLVLEAFRHHLFLDSFSVHYRPVQNISLMVDYIFWNDNPYGFHLTNVLLHAASAVLLYFLVRRILCSLFIPKLTESLLATAAFLSALLWAVHPVHSAAVDYISGRADSLAFFFAAGAWLLFLRAREAKRPGPRMLLCTLAAGAALLALCSRETACLWLLIFVLHTLAFARELPPRGKVAALLACLALFAIYGGLRHLPERRSVPTPDPGWSNPVRAALAFRALGDYGRLMVFPVNLHMERTVVNPETYLTHATWQQAAGSEYLSILGLFVAALLVLGCCWGGPGRRTRIFGTCWFVVGFLPISNLFNLNATVAEHWLYLPSVGLLLYLAGTVLDLPKQARPFLVTGAGFAALALSLCSADRSSDWTTPEHFYERTIAAGGNSARVSLNLGQYYAQRGNYGRAEKIFREILTNVPGYPIAEVNLASVLFHQGKKQEAEALFAAACAAAPQDRKEIPRTWLSAVNLAVVRRERKDPKGAIKILEQARADYPEAWEVVSLESEILRQTKGPAAAFHLVADFAQDNWWHYGAALALGKLYTQAGDAERGVKALRTASRLDVHEVDALNLIVNVRLRQHRLDDAYRTQKRAVARQPDAPRQYVLLSDILAQMGQTAAAKNAIAEGARLKALGRQPQALAN